MAYHGTFNRLEDQAFDNYNSVATDELIAFNGTTKKWTNKTFVELGLLTTTHSSVIASVETLGHIKVGSGLTIDGSGVLSATGATINGTTGSIAKFTGANSIGDSVITETSGMIGISTNPLNNSSGFDYGNGYDPTVSDYDNEKFRISSFFEAPSFAIGVAQNYLLRTEEFENAIWVRTGIGAVSANEVVAPNGAKSAESIPAGSDADSNIAQTFTDNSTGYWTAGIWARTQSGTATISLRFDSSGETGTAKEIALTTRWQFFSITQQFTSANTTKTFRIISGTTAISLWGARAGKGQTCNIYSARTSSALTTATPGIFASSLTIYGSLSGNATTASSTPYCNYGILFGNTLSNTTDNTNKWEYFGDIIVDYNSTYRFGNSWHFEVWLRELSNDNTTVPLVDLEVIKVTLKGNIGTVSDGTAFNSSVPSFTVDVAGNSRVAAEEIAGLVQASTTTRKTIRFYIKLKTANSHYRIETLSRYGASYSTSAVATANYCYFAPTAAAAVTSSLPTPAQGSVVYGTRKSGITCWEYYNDTDIFTNNKVGVGVLPTALLHLGVGTTSVPALKLSTGSLLTVPQIGALEWDGMDLYITQTQEDGYRQRIAFVEDIPSQAYPASGIANSTGTTWGTSYSTSGSGTVVALTNSPSFTTPSLGIATATSVNGISLTANATGFSVAGGTTSKTLTVSNSITLSGTDSSTLNIGTGGTLGTAAFTSATDYVLASKLDYGTTTGQLLVWDGSKWTYPSVLTYTETATSASKITRLWGASGSTKGSFTILVSDYSYHSLTENYSSSVLTSSSFDMILRTGASTYGQLFSFGYTVSGSVYSYKFNQLTSNGFLKTSGSDGTLSVDTTSYLPASKIQNGTDSGQLLKWDSSSSTWIKSTATIIDSGGSTSLFGLNTPMGSYSGNYYFKIGTYGSYLHFCDFEDTGVHVESTFDLGFRFGDGSYMSPLYIQYYPLDGTCTFALGISGVTNTYELAGLAPGVGTLGFVKTNGATGLLSYDTTVYEPTLGNPSTNGYVLASTTGGTRSWTSLPPTITINNAANYRIVTASNTANTLNGEALLSFDASTGVLTLGDSTSDNFCTMSTAGFMNTNSSGSGTYGAYNLTNYGGTSNANRFRGSIASGTKSSPTGAVANREMVQLGGRAYKSEGGWAGPIALISLVTAEDITSTNYGSYITFSTTQKTTTALTERVRINDNGYVGIGTSVPIHDLSFGIGVNRTIGVIRETTSSTAGRDLTISAGSAVEGGTNLKGGDIILETGISTGSDNTTAFVVKTPHVGASGTSDNALFEVMRLSSNGYMVMKSNADFGPQVNLQAYNSTAANASFVNFIRYRGTIDSISNISEGDTLGSFTFKGRINSAVPTVAMMIVSCTSISGSYGAGKFLFRAKDTSNGNHEFYFDHTGFITLSDSGGGINFSTDTNLYRSAASTLKTDDDFIAKCFISDSYSQVDKDSGLYIGIKDAANSWKIVTSGTDLVIQKHNGSIYVTKQTITG